MFGPRHRAELVGFPPLCFFFGGGGWLGGELKGAPLALRMQLVGELARVMQHSPDKSPAQLEEARNIKCLKIVFSL